MVKADKLNNALYAIHLLLVRCRFMAYSGEDHKDIAAILDYAEMLPRFIAVSDDMTHEFRKYLEGVVERYPNCSYILEKFDAPSIPADW
jgi:hypothetical protein